MKRREVAFAPEARDDLLSLYDSITEAAGSRVAMRYIERIEAYCEGFDLASERGRSRSDIRPGLRVVGFEHRLTLAFTVDEARVTILRIFRGGRDWENAFD